METEKKNFHLGTQWLGAILIVALGAVNLLLLRQNLTLRKQLSGGTVSNAFHGGERLDGFTGVDLNGQQLAIDFNRPGRKHIILYLSPSCPYCFQQAPLWRNLLDNLDGNRFDVVGVVSDKNEREPVARNIDELGYLKTKNPLAVMFLKDEALAKLRFVATPTTMIVSDTGVVEGMWVGKWKESDSNQVAAAMK